MQKVPRCLYCNAGSETTALKQETEKIAGLDKGFHYCSDACHQGIVTYAATVSHESNRFLLLILGAAFSFIPFVLLALLTPYHGVISSLAIAMPLILVGLVITRYPFVTPETIRFWGIRKSVAVAKRLGVGMILLGVSAAVVLWLLR